jgi:hypothetical protein
MLGSEDVRRVLDALQIICTVGRLLDLFVLARNILMGLGINMESGSFVHILVPNPSNASRLNLV